MLTVVSSEGEKTEADLRQTVVLSNSGGASPAGQCERNQSTQQERDRSAQQREALHMRSKELVNTGPNTIAVSTHCTFCICRHNEQYLLENPHNLR